jgi:CubicO group peptidase (beta-lactamase class C family)
MTPKCYEAFRCFFSVGESALACDRLLWQKSNVTSEFIMSRKAKIAFFVLVALPITAAPVTETKPEDVGLSRERLQRIHETIQRHIDSHDISGAVTLVARKGRIAHLEAHGFMDLESKKPMAKNSIFRIWSMSKPVAGAAILMLMEEGKVRLNDPISRFIPEFKGMKVAVTQEHSAASTGSGSSQSGSQTANSQPAPVQFYTIPAAREITIQDLLTHVSGLGSGPASGAEIRRIGKKPGDKLADYIPRWGSTPLDFQPGSRWTYSPLAAFDTLGRIVEVASGQTFDQFLRQRMFEPLGMKEIFFHPSEDRLQRIPSTYHRAGDALQKTDAINRMFDSSYFSGGGGLMATTEEYAKFAEMLLEGGQLNGKRLLSPKTVELMASVFVPDTFPGRSPGKGFGLSVQVISDAVAAGQRVSTGSFGWDGAYGTHFWVDPKEKIVGILMIQTDNPNRELDRDFENAVMQAIVE